MTPPSTASDLDKTLAIPPVPCRLHVLIIAALCFITAAAFWPSLRAGFVFWDDDTEIVKNPHIEGLTSSNVAWAFTNYDWVRAISRWIGSVGIGELPASRPRPIGYHVGNLLQHVACVVLLYFFILKLLRIGLESTQRRGRRNFFASIAAAGVGNGRIVVGDSSVAGRTGRLGDGEALHRSVLRCF